MGDVQTTSQLALWVYFWRSDPPIDRQSGPRIDRRGRSWFSLRAVPTRKPVVSGAAPYPKATARATADPPVHAKWPVRVLLRAVQPRLEVGGRMWDSGDDNDPRGLLSRELGYTDCRRQRDTRKHGTWQIPA